MKIRLTYIFFLQVLPEGLAFEEHLHGHIATASWAHCPEARLGFNIFLLEIPWGHPRLLSAHLIYLLLHQPKLLSDYLIHLLLHQPKLLGDYLLHPSPLGDHLLDILLHHRRYFLDITCSLPFSTTGTICLMASFITTGFWKTTYFTSRSFSSYFWAKIFFCTSDPSLKYLKYLSNLDFMVLADTN